MSTLAPASWFLLALNLVLLALAVWAFADAVARPAPAFPAAGKLTKPAWLGITALSAVFAWLFGLLSLFGSVAAVAVLVYLLDVRPAVREIGTGGSWG